MKIYCWIYIGSLVLLFYTVNASMCCKKITKKYYFSRNRVDNEEAHKLCVRNGMRLASIQSEKERIKFVDGLRLFGPADEEYVWISGKIYPERDPPFLWLKKAGDELELRQSMNYTNWANGYPNHKVYTQHLCIASVKSFDFKWANDNCNATQYVACESLY